MKVHNAWKLENIERLPQYPQNLIFTQLDYESTTNSVPVVYRVSALVEGLPDVVMIEIASHLRPRDLLACSAVSKRWREKFNKDAIWLPHLQFPRNVYRIEEKYKEMVLCPSDFTTLQPLCEARENYIRDQCLRFNWRAGLFTVDGLKLKTKGKINKIINLIDESGNYWLFVSTVKAIEVWNITNKPYCHTYVLKRLPDNLSDSLYTVGSRVVLISSDFVQVYSFESPKHDLILLGCFYFDNECLSVHGMPCRSRLWQENNIKHLILGNILIGYSEKCDSTCLPTVMHVWDLETVVKVGSVDCLPSHIIHSLHCMEETEDKKLSLSFDIHKGESNSVIISVRLETDNNFGTMLLLFSLENLVFTQFSKYLQRSSVNSCSVTDQKVLLLGHEQGVGYFVCLIDINTGKILSSNPLSMLGVQANSQLVCHCSSKLCLNTQKNIIMIETLEEKLVVSNVLQDDNLKNEIVKLASNNFMFSSNNCASLKMWDVNKKSCKELPAYLTSTDVIRIQSLTDFDFPPKVIFATLNNKVYVLNFF